jgi:hypothetical protein
LIQYRFLNSQSIILGKQNQQFTRYLL